VPGKRVTPAKDAARKKLLDAGLALIREQGFSATTIDRLCEHAGVTKGAFFHHFASKEAFGVAVAEYWSAITSAVFAAAPFQEVADPIERLLAYVAFRQQLISGGLAEFTCLAGTMLQEVYESSPEIGSVCGASILDHAATLEPTCHAALAAAGRRVPTARSLARYTQATVQGAFVLAKATGDLSAAKDALDHLALYLRLLLEREPRSFCPLT
jgi:TetR/AcrR family transcriptional regulator, transcriptional repressor for nem operon